MGQYSIGEALQQMMKKSGWTPKVAELRIREEWEQIAGKTIAKYTRELKVYKGTLTIYTDVAPLKQELNMAKTQLMQTINQYLGENAITEIVVR